MSSIRSPYTSSSEVFSSRSTSLPDLGVAGREGSPEFTANSFATSSEGARRISVASQLDTMDFTHPTPLHLPDITYLDEDALIETATDYIKDLWKRFIEWLYVICGYEGELATDIIQRNMQIISDPDATDLKVVEAFYEIIQLKTDKNISNEEILYVAETAFESHLKVKIRQAIIVDIWMGRNTEDAGVEYIREVLASPTRSIPYRQALRRVKYRFPVNQLELLKKDLKTESRSSIRLQIALQVLDMAPYTVQMGEEESEVIGSSDQKLLELKQTVLSDLKESEWEAIGFSMEEILTTEEGRLAVIYAMEAFERAGE